MPWASRAISLIALTSTLWAGDISGRAIITKKLGKKSVAPVVYNLRGTAPPAAGTDTESAAGEFERMVVMLEGGSLPPKPPVTALLDQHNLRFSTGLIVIPVGSTVEFPNSDSIFHNVFSLSKTQPFDLGFYPRGQSRSVKFNHPGIVQVYCHIHANMYAAIVVTDSPWFAKPAADGSFSWEGIPAGHYRLLAWHNVAGMHSVEVTVPPTGKVDVSIRVPLDVETRH
jgi:plastocyanin